MKNVNLILKIINHTSYTEIRKSLLEILTIHRTSRLYLDYQDLLDICGVNDSNFFNENATNATDKERLVAWLFISIFKSSEKKFTINLDHKPDESYNQLIESFVDICKGYDIKISWDK